MSALNTPIDTQQSPSSSDLATLRSVLFGKDYNELVALKDRLQDQNKYSHSVANVISEALSIRNSHDNSVAKALAPTIQSALKQSIVENPKPVVDALYPVMGPAIRKSVSEALSQMMATFNQLLEQKFTVRSLMWRFEAWKTGRSFSEVVLLKTLTFQVEQVFLINREDGLLLQHVAIDSVLVQDGDIISGMLTAIQDFINDSFSEYGSENTGINTLRLGDLTVFIEHSPKAIMAMVIYGKPPESIRRLQAATLEFIQKKYVAALSDFNGDNSPFDEVKPLLKRCLKSQRQETKTSRLPLIIFSMIFILGAGYWAYISYQDRLLEKQAQVAAQLDLEQQQEQWKKMLDALRSEPGLIVINEEQNKNKIDVLRDPLARLPTTVLNNKQLGNPVEFNTQPYLSIDDGILVLRAEQVLKPPQQVSLSVHNMVLVVMGKAPLDWSKTLQSRWRQVAGITQINTENLTVFDPDLSRIMTLKKEIKNTIITFENNKALLSDSSNELIKKVSVLMNKLLLLASKPISFSVMGYSDTTGTALVNNKLSQQRADRVKQQLISNGISEHLISRTTAKNKEKVNERSVHFQVIFK